MRSSKSILEELKRDWDTKQAAANDAKAAYNTYYKLAHSDFLSKGETKTRAPSVRKLVEDTFQEFTDLEFSVAGVEEKLDKQGMLDSIKDSRARIATALNGLEKKGKIVVSVPGTGTAPNLYKVITP